MYLNQYTTIKETEIQLQLHKEIYDIYYILLTLYIHFMNRLFMHLLLQNIRIKSQSHKLPFSEIKFDLNIMNLFLIVL